MENIYEIYENVLNNKLKRFPSGFWKNKNSRQNGIMLLRYIVKKLELTDYQIQEINVEQLTLDFKLRGLYLLYDNDLMSILEDSFPNLKFTKYYYRESYRNKQSKIIKNLSKEKWENIKNGIRNNRYTPEYGEKLSKLKRGELNYLAKLKSSQVIEIRQKWKTGNYTTTSLGNIYGVKRQTIADIVYERTWKHLL